MKTEEKISEGLVRLAQVQKSLSWQRAGEAGLSPTQAQILVQLYKGDIRRVRELAQHMGIAQPTVTESVGALARKDLVRKVPDPADGRGRILELTKAGSSLAAEAASPPPALVAAACHVQDKENMLVGLMDLISALNRAGALAQARVCFTCRHFDTSTGEKYCHFLKQKLALEDLQVDCPDHEAIPTVG